jgi:hypothetical protein
MKYSARLLALAGLIGLAFTWATDPRWGLANSGANPIDTANEVAVGTLVGIAGSIAVTIIALWLMTRRRI